MRYKIEFEIAVDETISEADVIEWARFELHDNGRMSGANPLVDRELEPVFGTLDVLPKEYRHVQINRRTN